MGHNVKLHGVYLFNLMIRYDEHCAVHKASKILDTMLAKQFKESRLLQQVLKLCQYANAVSVTPGIQQMPRRERIAALQELKRQKLAIPVEILAMHSHAMLEESFKAACHEETSHQAANHVTDLLALWKWASGNIADNSSFEDWSVDRPSFPALFAQLADQHKINTPGEEEAYAEWEASPV